MKHLTMAQKSLLIGDEAADVLVEYSALLARVSSGDGVTLQAIGVNGEEVSATLLLNPGTVLVVESSTSTLPEPDNTIEIVRMRDKIAKYEDPMLGFGGSSQR